jgi:hypothetical protein
MLDEGLVAAIVVDGTKGNDPRKNGPTGLDQTAPLLVCAQVKRPAKALDLGYGSPSAYVLRPKWA